MSANSKGGTNAQHNASLVKQGFIKQEEKKDIPDGMAYLFELYKEMRFSRVPPNTLMPRESLTFSSIKDYQELEEFKLSSLESTALLSIDCIYNNSSN